MYTPKFEPGLCPHCGEAIQLDSDVGYRMGQLMHLLDHALYATTGLCLYDVPDMPFWDIVSNPDLKHLKSTWDDMAVLAHYQLCGLFNSLGVIELGLISDEEKQELLRKTQEWIESAYPTGF